LADPPVSGRPTEPTLDEERLLAALELGLDPTLPAAQSEPAPPQAEPEPAPEPAAPPTAETTPSPPVKPPPAKSLAQPSKVAQSIMRAKEATRAIGTPQPRLLALGAVASLLSVGATVVLTGWIDPLALMDQKSAIGPVATTTAPAITDPATVVVAPRAQQADGTSLPVNNGAASTPPQGRDTATPASAKAGKKEAAVTALAAATVAPLPSRASPEPVAAAAPAPAQTKKIKITIKLTTKKPKEEEEQCFINDIAPPSSMIYKPCGDYIAPPPKCCRFFIDNRHCFLRSTDNACIDPITKKVFGFWNCEIGAKCKLLPVDDDAVYEEVCEICEVSQEEEQTETKNEDFCNNETRAVEMRKKSDANRSRLAGQPTALLRHKIAMQHGMHSFNSLGNRIRTPLH